MILPQFTIRTLLAICTVCALAFIVAGFAIRGQYWAWGITIGVASLVFTALVHAAWFGLVSLLARAPSQSSSTPARKSEG